LTRSRDCRENTLESPHANASAPNSRGVIRLVPVTSFFAAVAAQIVREGVANRLGHSDDTTSARKRHSCFARRWWAPKQVPPTTSTLRGDTPKRYVGVVVAAQPSPKTTGAVNGPANAAAATTMPHAATPNTTCRTIRKHTARHPSFNIQFPASAIQPRLPTPAEPSVYHPASHYPRAACGHSPRVEESRRIGVAVLDAAQMVQH
jgi:hypothetical protein